MQGRLSPASNNRIQFFPQNWEKEFSTAKEMGFSGVTWFLDREIHDFDPIQDVWAKDAFLERIDAARAALPIHSIDCGLYSMFGPDMEQTREDFAVLLPALAPRLTSRVVCVPMLEETTPKTEQEKKDARETLTIITAIAAQNNLRIALETEMPADELAAYIDSFGSPSIGVCYDTGNCTSYGFDAASDITKLGSRVFEVHLKDRKIGSNQSVYLGKGDTKFEACFRALKQISYTGGYTIQAWRGNDQIADATTQLQFVTNLLAQTNEK